MSKLLIDKEKIENYINYIKMKGTLKNKEGKWSIEYWDKLLPPNEIRSVLCELPLHPDSINGIEEPTDWVAYYYGREVEFEIVLKECKANLIGAECITNCECIQYAKLIQPKEENLSNNEYLLKAFEDSERELKQKETTTWDDIFEQHWEECEHNHMANFQDWLKEHYNVPIKKNNYDTH